MECTPVGASVDELIVLAADSIVLADNGPIEAGMKDKLAGVTTASACQFQLDSLTVSALQSEFQQTQQIAVVVCLRFTQLLSHMNESPITTNTISQTPESSGVLPGEPEYNANMSKMAAGCSLPLNRAHCAECWDCRMIGKLRVRRSGKMTLVVGDIEYKVEPVLLVHLCIHCLLVYYENKPHLLLMWLLCSSDAVLSLYSVNE